MKKIMLIFGLSLFIFSCASKEEKLVKAAKSGKINEVTKLVKAGAKINYQSKYGSSALHWAAYNGHTEIVKHLLDNGADVNLKNKMMSVPVISWAVHKKDSSIIKMLLNKGANVNGFRYYNDPLLQILKDENADLECAGLIAAKYTKINTYNNLHETALYLLVKNSKATGIPLMNSIIKMGADIQMPNNRGWTALHIASEKGKDYYVKALLEKKARVNAFTKRRETPLDLVSHLDATRPEVKNIKKLLQKNGGKLGDKILVEKPESYAAYEYNKNDYSDYDVEIDIARKIVTKKLKPGKSSSSSRDGGGGGGK